MCSVLSSVGRLFLSCFHRRCTIVRTDAKQKRCDAQGRRAKKPKKAATAALLPPSAMAFVGQDAGLTLFHALGKLLYNKRDAVGDPGPRSQPSQSSASEAAQTLRPQHAQQEPQAQQSGNAFIDLVSDDEKQEEGMINGPAQDAPTSSHWCAMHAAAEAAWANKHPSGGPCKA